jgi:hypothetical protein
VWGLFLRTFYLQHFPQEVICRRQVRGPWRPQLFINEIINHKESQNSRRSIGCLTSCAVLLKPTVPIELSCNTMNWLIKSRYAFSSRVFWTKRNSKTYSNFLRCKGVYWETRVLLYSIPCCCGCYVTPQVESSFIAEENTNQDISSTGINKDAKQATIIQSFYCTKLFNFTFM